VEKEINIVYLALGSNVGDSIETLQKALEEITLEIGSVEKIANFYKNEAMGFEADQEFVNTACLVHTDLSPQKLLEKTQEIEKNLGRKEKSSGFYSSRTIDIDILYFNQLILESKNLTIPHPLLSLRDFVLCPMNDIAPNHIDLKTKQSINHLFTNLNKFRPLIICLKKH
jgi:2-amino-4-hydroxy-6-hydroxymethyldihydropteridine diphosphokinase